MVEVSPSAVRNVGTEAFPALADIYEKVAKKLREADGVSMPRQSGMEESFRDYIGVIGDFFSISDSRLRHCGEVLVEVADDLEKVDEDNAKSIAEPVSGMPEERN